MAAFGALITILVLSLGGQVWGQGGPSLPGALIAPRLSIVFISVVLGSRRISSVGDVTGEPLESVLVQAGQILAMLLGVQAAFWNGNSGLVELMPLLAAVVGATVQGVSVDEGGRRLDELSRVVKYLLDFFVKNISSRKSTCSGKKFTAYVKVFFEC